jgi:hypothetical protein
MDNQSQAKVYSSFDAVNADQSSQVYRQFLQGKVVIKLVYNEIKVEMEENPLFTLLFNHQSHFENLYRHLGYELCFHSQGDFYYAREAREDATDEADDNALKIQTTLLLLGRYYSGTGRDLNLLGNPQFGLNDADYKALHENEEFNAILKAVNLDNWDRALGFLTKRNFAFKSGVNQYFLSQAGSAFLLRLVTEYESRV